MYFTSLIGIELALVPLVQHAKHPKKTLKTARTIEIINAAPPNPTPYFQLSLPVDKKKITKFLQEIASRCL